MKEYKVIIDGDRQEWFLNDKRHREDGPAIIDGDRQEWWLNGKRHREDGPAIIKGDRQSWWLNGKQHREDGPAIIYGNCQSWWLNDKQVSEQEFDKRIKVKEITIEEQCDCCFGKGVIEEWDGDEGSCMNCNGSGKLKYSPFRKLIEFGDEKIKKEIDDYYFIDKSRLMNIENVMIKLREENKKLKKELEEYKFNETFNKKGNNNE
ncbi:MAG: hypothetical protein RBT49_04120 [Bacteroidales bacterium]|nr:hypothetical protein [Bacteroidales bacterium]